MIIKEQRSISFSQSERDKQFQQFQRSLKPPTQKSSVKDLQLSSRTNDSQNILAQQMPPLNPRKNSKQQYVDHQKSYDSQIYEGEQKLSNYNNQGIKNQQTYVTQDCDQQLAIVIQSSSGEQTFEDDDQQEQLASHRSVRTLKSLQSERFNRKAQSRQRSDTGTNNDEVGFQFQHVVTKQSNLNDSQGYIQLKTKEAYQQVTQRMKLSTNPFQLQDPYLSTDNTKKETMQSMATLGNMNQSIDRTLEDNQFHSRRMSRSSGNIFRDEKTKMGQVAQKQWYHIQQTSMVQGEKDSLDGGVSEQSILEIPNEYLNLPTQLVTQQNSDDKKPPRNSSEKKGTQRLRPGQSQNTKKFLQSTQQSTQSLLVQKPGHINTVRDSSPLKTMGIFAHIRDSQNNQKGSMSERQRFIQQQPGVDVSTKMFAQKAQFINTFKSSTQSIENNYKQPKQGQRRQHISSQHQQRHHIDKTQNSSLYNTQNSPQESRRESLLKNLQDPSFNYVTQSKNQEQLRQFQSDFIHSKEEEELDIANQSHTIGVNAFEQSSFNIGQSFHLPQTQALYQAQKNQSLFGVAAPKINNLNLKGACQQQSTSHQQNTYQEDQPVSGNLNDLQLKRPSIRTNKFQQLNENMTIDVTASSKQRTNSNFRNESLERILGDKATSLFDQIEKITRKDYVKVNRSILHTSNDRVESLTRNLSQTPLILQNQEKILVEQIKEPRTNHIQRKRQLTFSDQNQQSHNSYRLQLNDNNQAQQKQLNQLERTNQTLITDIEDCTLLQTDKKESNLPKSPTNFPSSVKDKIKNITERMKQEIQKQSQDTKTITQKQLFESTISQVTQNSGSVHQKQISQTSSTTTTVPHQMKLSKIQVEETHTNQIRQVSMRDHFKKYLNGQKNLEKPQKDDDLIQKQNIKKVRNSNIETSANHSQMFLAQKKPTHKPLNKNGTLINKISSKKLESTSKILPTNQNPPLTQVLCQPQILCNNSNQQQQVSQSSPKQEKSVSSMFQKCKQSGTGQQSKQTKVRKSKLTQSSQFQKPLKKGADSYIVQQANNCDIPKSFNNKQKKKVGDFECIIYLPNQPPEVVTSNQLDQIQQQQVQVAQITQQYQEQNKQFQQEQNKGQEQQNLKQKSQNATQVHDKENIESQKSSRVLNRQPSSRLELKFEDNQEQKYILKEKSCDQVDESAIQVKYNNLLKETRSKIKEIDVQKYQQTTPKQGSSFKSMTQFLIINSKPQMIQEYSDINDDIKMKDSTLRRSYNTNSFANSIQKQKVNTRQQSVVQSPRNQNVSKSNLNFNKVDNNSRSDQLFDQVKINPDHHKSCDQQSRPSIQQNQNINQCQHQIQYSVNNFCHNHCACTHVGQGSIDLRHQQSQLQQQQMISPTFSYIPQPQLTQHKMQQPYLNPPMTNDLYNNYYYQLQQQQQQIQMQFNQMPINNLYTQYNPNTNQIMHHSDQLFGFPQTPSIAPMTLQQSLYPYQQQYQTVVTVATAGLPLQYNYNQPTQQYMTANFYSPYHSQNVQSNFGLPPPQQIDPLNNYALHQQMLSTRAQVLSGMGLQSTTSAQQQQQYANIHNIQSNGFKDNFMQNGNNNVNNNSNDNHLSLGAQLEKALNDIDKLDEME